MPGLVLTMDVPTGDRVEIEQLAARHFAGLVVSQPGELDDEPRAGAWDVRRADASLVLDADPAPLWNEPHTGSWGSRRRVSARQWRAR